MIPLQNQLTEKSVSRKKQRFYPLPRSSCATASEASSSKAAETTSTSTTAENPTAGTKTSPARAGAVCSFGTHHPSPDPPGYAASGERMCLFRIPHTFENKNEHHEQEEKNNEYCRSL